MTNNTDYPLQVKTLISGIKLHEDDELKLHQRVVVDFMIQDKIPTHRGILLAHVMGSGKTRLVVFLAEEFKKKFPNKRIIVMANKTLEGNFRKNIIDNKFDDTKYKFVTLNASNMYKQIVNVDKTQEEVQYEKMLNVFIDSHESLENSIFIIDEAHNIFNSITNGSQNTLKLYDLIMKTKNIKLIFMTGSPIVNDPFELVPCFNMLAGSKIFSEDLVEFENYFIDKEDFKIKEKDKFTNRIYGLVSYYGDIYFKTTKVDFPIKLDTIIEYCPMALEQYAKYSSARLKEIDETSKFKKQVSGRFSSDGGASSSYRVKTRQICNAILPMDVTSIDSISKQQLLNIEQYSTKMKKMLDNILKNIDDLHIVYSQFVTEGLGIFSRVLEANGFVQFKDFDNVDLDLKDNSESDLTYAIISGNVTIENRNDIINMFNSKPGLINVLLISAAASEGIDLKRVRFIHVMEPFWNYARINQVETRANRYRSHVDMPKEKQNTQTYIYLSDYPVDVQKIRAELYPDNNTTEENAMLKVIKVVHAIDEKKILSEDEQKFKRLLQEDTTDITLYKKSIKNMVLNNSFIEAIAEASIDCYIHNKDSHIKCKLCNPNNKKLFHQDLDKDMELSNNCQAYTPTTIKTILINYNGKKYYLNKNTYELYSYDDSVNAMKLVPNGNAIYNHVLNTYQA